MPSITLTQAARFSSTYAAPIRRASSALAAVM
jgi:hypothetical protein